MESKAQLQKIFEWLKQINRSVANLQDGQDKLSDQVSFLEKKMNLGVRVEQFNDRSRFEKEIHKIRQEIRELMH